MMAKKTGELIDKKIKIVTDRGDSIKLNYLISDSGGQGDVYHVTYDGHDYALKWYNKAPEDVIGGLQYNVIKNICGRSKRPSDKCIWPMYMVTEVNPCEGKKFGYLMELLPPNYPEMNDYMRMDDDPDAARFSSYNALLTAGMNIAAAMHDLHLKGYSYKDLNPSNFAINPDTGDVLVVDNDNVSVNGDPSTVKGMKGYMAPEIPRSKYKESPTMYTDYYSLAVILYRLFFVDHPMDGKAWEKYPLCTDEVEEFLYAIKPVFHFDPNNKSNVPTDVYAPNVVQRWKCFPMNLRRLFIQSFTEGIDHPGRRVPENAWISTLADCRDKLIRMMNKREQFVNFDNAASVPPGCLGIQIGSHKVALYPFKAVYEISVNGNVNRFAEKYAGILYNDKTKTLMIRNLTNKTWRGWSPKDKVLTSIGPGMDYPVFPGVQIEFQKENPQIKGIVFDPKNIQ